MRNSGTPEAQSYRSLEKPATERIINTATCKPTMYTIVNERSTVLLRICLPACKLSASTVLATLATPFAALCRTGAGVIVESGCLSSKPADGAVAEETFPILFLLDLTSTFPACNCCKASFAFPNLSSNAFRSLAHVSACACLNTTITSGLETSLNLTTS